MNPGLTTKLPQGLMSSPDLWRLVEPSRALSGFAYGLRHPCIVEHVAVAPMAEDRRQRVTARLRRVLGDAGVQTTDLAEVSGEGSIDATVAWYLALIDRANAWADLPILDTVRCIDRSGLSLRYAVPCMAKGGRAMAALLETVRSLANESDAPAMPDADIGRAFLKLRASNLSGTNAPRFMRTAIEAAIPVQELPGKLVQYGLGRNATVMDSTFTQFTPAIGLRAARDKSVASQLLHRFRLPVARHGVAGDVEAALAIAAQIGYPVVAKPADSDGGKGVQADLRNEDEVRRAFAEARQVSARVMIEQHSEGRDYRLMVFRGRLIWAIERQPAGVVGDGTTSIADLVAQANADPARGDTPHAGLKPIKLDQHALDLLARDGLSPDSIPAKGLFQRLRRAANVSTGGTPIAVFDAVHRDNAALAARAAEIFKLDLAGIDLIIPDIATSWRESGAIICEVNAQPHLGTVTSRHIYPQLLKALVRGDGRIPVIAFLGDANDCRRHARRAAAIVRQVGLRAGIHLPEGIAIADRWLERATMPCLSAGRILCADQSVEALLLAAIDNRVLGSGLPVPRIDLLVVSGDLLRTTDPADEPGSTVALLRMILPACDRIVSISSPESETDGEAHVLDRLKATYSTTAAEELAHHLAPLLAGTAGPAGASPPKP